MREELLESKRSDQKLDPRLLKKNTTTTKKKTSAVTSMRSSKLILCQLRTHMWHSTSHKLRVIYDLMQGVFMFCSFEGNKSLTYLKFRGILLKVVVWEKSAT